MIQRPVAVMRARLLAAIREFFDTEGHLEVDTPSLARELIPEAHISVFETTLVRPHDAEQKRYLIPSPEVHMKQLLARGFGSIYRLGRSFRNAEIPSRIHAPEFTMLEWYTVDADYRDSLERTQRLLAHVVQRLWPQNGGDEASPAWLSREPTILSVEDAFMRFAGAPARVFDRPDGMRATAEHAGMEVRPEETEDELFQRVFLNIVEPALPADRPVYLTDYPALVPTLAQRRAERPALCERWELYVAGTEIANCYSEERKTGRLREYLTEQTRACAQAADRPTVPTAESLVRFSAAPPCSGVALGVDRLLMVLLGEHDIRGVIFTG